MLSLSCASSRQDVVQLGEYSFLAGSSLADVSGDEPSFVVNEDPARSTRGSFCQLY